MPFILRYLVSLYMYSLKVLGVKGLENCFWDFHGMSGEHQLCNTFFNPKTDFISVMTYFAKRDHLQLIKVLKSYKLTD